MAYIAWLLFHSTADIVRGSVKVLTNVRNYYFSYHGCLRQGTFYSIKLSN